MTDLQHDDRGRRARGHGRARRDDVRVRRGPRGRAAGRRVRGGRRALAHAAHATTGARFDTRGRRRRRRARRRRSRGAPRPTWSRPSPTRCPSRRREGHERALQYMGLEAGTPIEEIALDRVFIGSCTNCRIGDLRAAAEVVKGRKVASSVNAMVVPGSQQVKAQAEREGLDEVFTAAGFDWRVAGCSMCLGMNPDTLAPGERCASTSNRNFEGRQGRGGRTHLVSPADGRRRRHRGPLRRHPRPGARADHGADHDDHTARSACSTATTSTPTRSCPSSSSSGSSGPASASSSSTTGRRRTAGTCRANPILVTGTQLRLRLLARARAVGPAGLRLPGDRRAELRRHLLSQLHEDRAAAGRARPRTQCKAVAAAGEAEVDLADQVVRAGRAGVRLRDRPGHPPPPAQRPRRHRDDAAAAPTRSTTYEQRARAHRPRHHLPLGTTAT